MSLGTRRGCPRACPCVRCRPRARSAGARRLRAHRRPRAQHLGAWRPVYVHGRDVPVCVVNYFLQQPGSDPGRREPLSAVMTAMLCRFYTVRRMKTLPFVGLGSL